MPCEPLAGEDVKAIAIQESYLNALLLSGCAKQAENAVARAIESEPTCCPSRRSLLGATVTKLAEWPEVDSPTAITALPEELRDVLRLPCTRRRCFVLRMLAEWPLEACATTLGMATERIDAEARAAAQTLAGLREKESLA